MDKNKTKEELLHELTEIRKQLQELDASCTEDKHASETLRYFEKAFETMQIGVTITDLEGAILYINPADLQMHGYTEDELSNGNIRTFSVSGDRRSLTDRDLTIMKRWKRESVNKRKNGDVFPVQLMSDIIKNSEGKAVGIVTTCEDISERKKMETEIKERIEELEMFYEVSIHREAKMRELKEEIKKLKQELSQYNSKAAT